MAIKTKLKIMFFMQYFIWGSWLVTLGSYMINTLNFSGSDVGLVYGAKGLACIIAPSIMGMIADRWVKANRLYGFCHLMGAIALFAAAKVGSAETMFFIMLFNAMMYMPTIALSNTVGYFSLENAGLDTVKNFPAVRVYGTIGFIIAMWGISLTGFELNNMQLYIASAVSLLLALYTFTLPNCPTAKKTKDRSLLSQMGFDAFVLFKDKTMAVFFLFAMLLGAALQVTNTFGSPFLHDFAAVPEFADSLIVKFPSILLSVSQIAEVFFIITIPFFLAKYGIKRIMLISMIAWTLRFGLFAFGDPTTFGAILLLMSMIVYGCAFDFFNISGAIFVEQAVDKNIRASAQGLFMTMINGIGAYVGALASGRIVDFFTVNGVRDWQSIWLVFASYTLVLAIIFMFSFNYKHQPKQA